MANIKVEWEVNLWKKKLRVLKRLGLSTGLEPQKVLQGISNEKYMQENKNKSKIKYWIFFTVHWNNKLKKNQSFLELEF